MFENFVTNLKLHSLKVSGSLTNFKNNTNNGLGNFKSKLKGQLSPLYDNVEHNPIPQSPSSPIRSSKTNTMELKWPILIENEMHWVPHVPSVEDEKEDIVERFTNISNVNQNFKVRSLPQVKCPGYLLFFVLFFSTKTNCILT